MELLTPPPFSQFSSDWLLMDPPPPEAFGSQELPEHTQTRLSVIMFHLNGVPEWEESDRKSALNPAEAANENESMRPQASFIPPSLHQGVCP